MSCAVKTTPPFISIAEYLGKAPLFVDIGAKYLREFVDAARLYTAPKGKVLFIQGDKANYVYLIVDGWVKLFRETLEGTEAVIDVLTSNHSFGDTSVFEDGYYSYSAEVAEHTRYITLPISMVKSAITTNHQFALNMLLTMSQHRHQQSREIEHLNNQNAPQRIGCFLLRLCPVGSAASVTLNLPYDKALIASRLGIKPETFSRALVKLRAETQIEIQGPTVIIHDLQRLVSYTCNHCSSSFPCKDVKG